MCMPKAQHIGLQRDQKQYHVDTVITASNTPTSKNDSQCFTCLKASTSHEVNIACASTCRQSRGSHLAGGLAMVADGDGDGSGANGADGGGGGGRVVEAAVVVRWGVLG